MRDSINYDIGKRLFLELGTSLQLELKGLQLSIKSELIGMEVGKFLIVKMLKMDGVKIEQMENSDVLVMYLQKGSILGFHSSVISIVSCPEDMAFIKYPQVIENYNVRSFKRVDCFLPAKFEINHNIVDGAIVDISDNGCCCKVENFTIINEDVIDNIVIYFQSGESKNSLMVKGRVGSIRHMKNEINIGVTFQKLDNEARVVISDLIPDLLLQYNYHSLVSDGDTDKNNSDNLDG